MAETKNLQYALPDSLRRTLKRGEYAAYQLVDVSYNGNGSFVGRTVGIPNKDIVYDSNGNMTPIAYVQGYTSEGIPSLGSIWFSVDSECIVLCMSGVKHASLYNYLEISNYNESNPNRDPNIPALYRRVDSINNAKQTREQRNERVAALKAVLSMSDVEIEEFLQNNKNIGVRVTHLPTGEKDWDAIRDALERWAEINPQIILNATKERKSTDDAEIEALIKFGQENDLIGFDKETKSWYGASGKPFLKVISSTNQNHVAELIGYLKSGNGLKIYEKLKSAKKAE